MDKLCLKPYLQPQDSEFFSVIKCDEEGTPWVPFIKNNMGGVNPVCNICGEEFESGWVCISKDMQICNKHVEIENE